MLFFGTVLETSPVLLNQVQAAGTIINNVSRQFSKGKSLRGIHFQEEKLNMYFNIWGAVLYHLVRLLKKRDRERPVKRSVYE